MNKVIVELECNKQTLDFLLNEEGTVNFNRICNLGTNPSENDMLKYWGTSSNAMNSVITSKGVRFEVLGTRPSGTFLYILGSRSPKDNRISLSYASDDLGTYVGILEYNEGNVYEAYEPEYGLYDFPFKFAFKLWQLPKEDLEKYGYDHDFKKIFQEDKEGYLPLNKLKDFIGGGHIGHIVLITDEKEEIEIGESHIDRCGILTNGTLYAWSKYDDDEDERNDEIHSGNIFYMIEYNDFLNTYIEFKRKDGCSSDPVVGRIVNLIGFKNVTMDRHFGYDGSEDKYCRLAEMTWL